MRTVEHLAEARDDICAKVPGLNQLKATAQAWLAKAKTGAEAAIQAKQHADMQNQIDTQARALRDQGELIEKLQRERAK